MTGLARLQISPYKARGVVVPDGLGVAVRLQNRVGLHDPVLQVCLLFLIGALLLARSENGKVRDDLLGVLGLACARLATKHIKENH